jgi:hypothetical protein
MTDSPGVPGQERGCVVARVLAIRARMGEISVEVSCDIPEGYSPDVADDLSARASSLMKSLAEYARVHGVPTVGRDVSRPGA